MKLETIAIHAGNIPDASTKAAIQPITLSTTFERQQNKTNEFVYSRIGNPNRLSLENVLSKLEGGQDACAFSSGNAAGMAVFQAMDPGSHVIVPDDMYHGLRNGIKEVFGQSLSISFVDMTNSSHIEREITADTKLIWIETPSNPLLNISDIENISRIAKKNKLHLACDSTFATPVFQQPLQWGADIVMHSTTKYLSGHSDVLGGALICSKKNSLWEKIRKIQEYSGAVPSPFDCYLTVRGIKTLPYRMRGHAENAEKLALFIKNHPLVEAVYYPGLHEHPQYEIAKKQMSGFSGMLSFLVKGGAEEAFSVVRNVKIFTNATSLGGVESLIEQRASVEGPDTKTPQNLVRISVGLENIEDLINDINQALDSSKK
ncbi:MAG TPA: aminotransferase class I/II-fold pyridoxal phosphate-dependent enzyme [Sphingobacteriaceae bacterium]|nr:aminotransferase class I/II-fold pyridoxal phosphate-dependent enzyme [Sphingobacteriaceae bacterium]